MKDSIDKVLLSPHRKRVEFTRTNSKGELRKGIAYYYNNVMLKMKNRSTNPTRDDVWKAIFPKRNHIPKSNKPIPPRNELSVSHHGQVRSAERFIIPAVIYDTILNGIAMDMSNPKVTKTKYFKDTVEVVVAWEPDGALIVTEINAKPIHSYGFLEGIPLMFEELRNIGVTHGGWFVFDKMTHLEQVASLPPYSRILEQIALMKLMEHKLTEEQKKQLRLLINFIAPLQNNHVKWEYDMNKGHLVNEKFIGDRAYTSLLFLREVTPQIKEILSKWGVDIDENVDVMKDHPGFFTGDAEIFLFEMPLSLDWAFSKKRCKLTQM